MKIALIGFGLEAKTAFEFLSKKFKHAIFDIYDENQKSKVNIPKGVNFYGNFHDFSNIEANLIVRTPAVNPGRLPKNAHVTSVTNLFFENCSATIIGVTGSKGKGTVSSFIAEILRSSGLKTHLVGNIGVPALDKLVEISPQDVVVYELSSFQLWDIEKAPHISVLNNIEPDHLDVHNDFNDYISAKMNIAKKQTIDDIFIFNQNNKEVISSIKKFEHEIVSEKLAFPNADLASVQGDFFYWGGEPLFEVSILKLPGRHNQQNALAAMTATFYLFREKGFELEEIIDFWRQGLSKFDGLPHRLKFIREVNGVEFFDDSIATTPGSAIAALNSFNSPKILILGGSDKGADLSELIKKISTSKESDIKKVILIGAESSKLEQKLISVGFSRFMNLGVNTNMNEIVHIANSYSSKGDVVILSPAHASFDMFNSYVDRGEQFIKAVENL